MNNKKNIFDAIPKELPEEYFETLLSTPNITIERIISKGHSSPESGWYDQDKNEWVLLLEGEAIICFEDKEDVRLSSGDYIHINAHIKHKVLWTTPDKNSVWLAIFY